jgi:hypothetical protein
MPNTKRPFDRRSSVAISFASVIVAFDHEQMRCWRIFVTAAHAPSATNGSRVPVCFKVAAEERRFAAGGDVGYRERTTVEAALFDSARVRSAESIIRRKHRDAKRAFFADTIGEPL